jgi:hypothetical protein
MTKYSRPVIPPSFFVPICSPSLREDTMTPQERQQVTELFDRLATLEGNRRDPEAEALIAEGTRHAPHSLYALVQTTLIQDEALREADARIRELEGGGQAGAPGQGGGFLDNMRETFLGRRGSVPSVGGGRETPWQSQGQGYGRAPEPQTGGGGSFLGTAAASAAGVIGGALLLNSFRGMFGGNQQQQHGMLDQGGGNSPGNSPWSGGNAANSDLARDAGVNEIGRSGSSNSAASGGNDRAGLFDTASNQSDDDETDYEDDGDSEMGDSDVA